MLRIKLVKSPIGNTPRNRATVQALGLRKVSQTVDHEDNSTIRGMIHHVKHMLLVTEIADSEAKPRTPKPTKAAKPVVAAAAAPKAEAKPKAAPKKEAVAKPAAAKAAKPAAKKATEGKK